MANINVTYEDIRNAATKLTSGKDEIISRLGDMDALVNNLVASGFTTDHASVAFDNAFDEFVRGSRQTIEGLEGLANFLRSAADQMHDTDQGLANSIRNA